jgi:hypothetical protein
MRACVYPQRRPRDIFGAKPPAGAARAAGEILPAASDTAHQQCAARRRSQNFFWRRPAWGVPEGHQGACWASKLPPVFKAVENDGAQRPIVFRWVLAPDSHGKSPHWSPPVLRLAAAVATPLARSRSTHSTNCVADSTKCAGSSSQGSSPQYPS